MKSISRYGYDWPEGSNDLSIELACYADNALFPKRSSTHLQFDTGRSCEYHLKQAWRIMWPDFVWNEWAERIVWAWCNYEIITAIGCSAAGKTFTTSRIILLDYLAKPYETSTTVTTTKFDALRTRIWGDVMQAIEQSAVKNFLYEAFKPTTTSNELKFQVRSKTKADVDKFLIQGVAADTSDVNATKLRGQHTPRRRIAADECEHMGEVLFSAIDNARGDLDFKAILLTNPSDRSSDYCQKWAKPVKGWSSVDENTEFWETEQPKGVCVHFNALHSPNVKARKVVCPGLAESNYVETLRITEGEHSVKWYMFVLGFPPPDGMVNKVWPSATIEQATPAATFDFPPEKVATLDPAFTHDDCVLMFADLGRLRDGKPCCSATKSVKLQISDAGSRILKEDQIAQQVKAKCEEAGVKPENFIMDTTAQGRGVYSLLTTTWSPKVQGISYSDATTDRPLRLNDAKKASEQVLYFSSELWFRASYLAKEGMLCGLSKVDKKTKEDLASRQYSIKTQGGSAKMIVENKDELKKRLGRSPDFGDAFCQFGELMVRKGLLAEFGGVSSRLSWAHCRKLAQKAASRFSGEFTHGTAPTS